MGHIVQKKTFQLWFIGEGLETFKRDRDYNMGDHYYHDFASAIIIQTYAMHFKLAITVLHLYALFKSIFVMCALALH